MDPSHYDCFSVSKNGSNWYWEVKSEDRTVLDCGVAATEVLARIAAIASWWQTSEVTESERTPFARLLASVIGGSSWAAWRSCRAALAAGRGPA